MFLPNTLSPCERVELLNERSEFSNSGEGLELFQKSYIIVEE